MHCTLRALQQLERQWTRPVFPRNKSISFIGLGRMGAEMAFNLFRKTRTIAPDTQLVVCDSRLETASSFADSFTKHVPGSTIGIAFRPEEAVIASSTIITMLPSSPQVESVYTGEFGMLPELAKMPEGERRDTLFIDGTTLDVDVGRAVAAQARGLGAEMVDAPVSGGVTGAKASTLSFLVGGPEQSFERAKPFLGLMGGRILHCGPSGAGLAAKICNNLVLGVEQVVVAEAMLLGQKLGLDAKILADVINSSTGGCWASSVNNPVSGALTDKEPPCERDYEGGFATGLMLKDLGLATTAAAATGSSSPLAGAAEGIYRDAVERHGELWTKDFSSVYSYLERAGEEGKVVRIGPVKVE
ncbi:NAD binding domain of 6-phosphogluconate dehydrogenase-domain-containing protein [Vararia minispora EC-137]|uniref:NAD binding domain of 6-phosphogluconate dehydrogenase-domain-containing protein n=1 Tax=Vararia minispora EC-137 TaxID=1314806 RepID=A0ACB8QDQ0_9AGAM|nr:NAD binding domain of 6-phosphogluconate dehydrogenase-domain-containing protein [Vararia minispora EC-137]